MKTKISKKTKKKLLLESSKFALDLAKLVFAGLILAGVKDLDIHVILVISFGVISLVILVFIGLFCFLIGNYKK